MTVEAAGADIVGILNSLYQLTLRSKESGEALKVLTRLGRRAMGVRACSVALVDLEGRHLTVAACSSFDEGFERLVVGRRVRLGARRPGEYIDYDLVARGQVVERTNLQADGQGVADHQVARKYDLRSVLSYPLKSRERLVGYFNSFSSSDDPATPEQRRLLELFAAHAVLTIEQLEHYRALDSLRTLNGLSHSLLSPQPKDALWQVAAKACELLAVPVCIVWELDKDTQQFKVVAAAGKVGGDYWLKKLPLEHPAITRFLSMNRTASLVDVSKARGRYIFPEEAERQGWKSIMSTPLRVGSRPVGLLDVYTLSTRHFSQWERELFAAFANQVALSIHKSELLQDNFELRERQKQDQRDQSVAEIREALARIPTFQQGPLTTNHNTFNVIAEKCVLAAGADACFLRLRNGVSDELVLRAFYTVVTPAPQVPIGHKLRISEGISGHVAREGQPYVCGDVRQDPERGKLYESIGLRSVLCVPIKSGEFVIGTISVGHYRPGAFGRDERRLLEKVVEVASHAIERTSLTESVMRLKKGASESQSLDTFLKDLGCLTRELLREAVCVVWLLDKNRNGFVVKEPACDTEQGAALHDWCISLDTKRLDSFLARSEPTYFEDAGRPGTHPYSDRMAELGWVSLLAAPLIFKDRPLGILEVYSVGKRRAFTDWHKQQFKMLAAQAAMAVESLNNPKRFERFQRVYHELTECGDENQLWGLLLERSLELIGSSRGRVCRPDFQTGRMKIMAWRGESDAPASIEIGRGISGVALCKERPVRVGDVREARWRGVYEECWAETRSELAVPILVSNAQARVGRGPQAVTKPVGVINVESPTAGAFTQADEDVLWSLARHAATVIEKLESDRKLPELQNVERAINEVHGWDETMAVMARAITETLGFEYVNVSLVEPEAKRIRTEYIAGIPEEDVEEFKRLAQHPLDSNDIQACVVRTGAVEVPEVDDARFDEQIYKRFKHERLIRVFVPMVASSGGQVMGTVEAGYRRGYRKHIYEHHVRTLQRFVDYVARAFERRRRALLPRILHELEAPTVGIRNNVGFMKTHRDMGEGLLQLKYDDILTDCELLLLKIGELEYIFGGASPVSRRDRTLVYRDIIIKTINQLKPLVAERGFDMEKIKYNVEDIPKIKIYVDKAKLNSVVYNLLINAIKYAENNPARFGVVIAATVTRDKYVIKVKDWGIGINKSYAEKIFEEGFRAPEAAARFVTGSGLGLTIARKAMREIGGDLLLANCSKPTEFHLLLPKSLKEVPHDSVRR